MGPHGFVLARGLPKDVKILKKVCFGWEGASSVVRGLLGTDPRNPPPSNPPALPSSGVDLASKSGNRCRINVEWIPKWTPEEKGEVDSKVRSGGLVPSKPLTILACWVRTQGCSRWELPRASLKIVPEGTT